MSSESVHGLGRRRFEFSFPEWDLRVLVEECEGEVVVRATRDRFSRQRKEFFIRELAQEGFIPDGYCWTTLAEPGSFRGVRWIIDSSWLRVPVKVTVRARRFMIRLLASATVGWLGALASVIVHTRRR
ncbi:MAG: hypothetical protein ACREFX_07710 [Opitutaceae bacterium]